MIVRTSRIFRPVGALAALVLLLSGLGLGTGEGSQTWLMGNGEEYFGQAIKYDFKSKYVTILKADGKEFTFRARDLAFPGKLQLIDSPAFGVALQSYRPPLLPVLVMILALAVAGSLPTLVGLWTAANLFGSIVPVKVHLVGFLKVLLVLVIQGGIWLISAIFFDAGRPLVPDTNADIVMTLTVLVVGLLACSLVVAFHYHRSFWKGMAISCLAGVFGSIVAVAMALVALFVATRMDHETLFTKLVFEPFAIF